MKILLLVPTILYVVILWTANQPVDSTEFWVILVSLLSIEAATIINTQAHIREQLLVIISEFIDKLRIAVQPKE